MNLNQTTMNTENRNTAEMTSDEIYKDAENRLVEAITTLLTLPSGQKPYVLIQNILNVASQCKRK